MEVRMIGTFQEENGEQFIKIEERFRRGLKGIEEFSHLVVLWWFDQLDGEEYRSVLEMSKPYRKAPEVLGVFATRSPVRPNSIGSTVVEVTHCELEKGRIYVTYEDAFPGTPILDLKPYTPSIERVEQFEGPKWCSHWPQSFEKSGEFDWEQELISNS